MMIRWLCALGVVACCSVRAATPEELRKAIEAGESLTLIDVRPAAVFMTGHIPNAINVPASLVSQKQLPPLGRVVVYDEGLGRDTAKTAVAALNQKPGIRAEILEGGLAAWEQAQSPTTASAGMQAEKLPFISYDHLKKTPTDDMVVVDLRKHRPSPTGQSGQLEQLAAAPGLTDLAAEFPGAAIVHSHTGVTAKRKSGLAGTKEPLLVLVDNGDGAAQETARMLKANGMKRFVILAGGEQTLARKGKPGLQRVGSTITLRNPRASTNQINQ